MFIFSSFALIRVKLQSSLSINSGEEETRLVLGGKNPLEYRSTEKRTLNGS